MKKVLLCLTGLFIFAGGVSAGPKYISAEKLVPTAGTRVALASVKTMTTHAIIKARANNAGLVYIGGVTMAAGNGYHLAANAEVKLSDLISSSTNESFDLAGVYVDAATNGDGVRIIYVTDRFKP